MQKKVNRGVFFKLFENIVYRKKLDQMILHLFGLENYRTLEESEIQNHEVLLQFIVFLDFQELFRIKVVVSGYFRESRDFYIHLSFAKVHKTFSMDYDGILEIYCRHCYFFPYQKKEFFRFAGIFFAKTSWKVRKILQRTKVFQKEEIQALLKILREKSN